MKPVEKLQDREEVLHGDRLSILIPLIHFNPTHSAGNSKAEFCRLACSARQSVPIPEYKKNLGLIIDRLQGLGAAVMVITPPPVDDQARVKLALQVRTDADKDQLFAWLAKYGSFSSFMCPYACLKL